MGILIGSFILSIILSSTYANNPNWWKNGVFYQIYPRSFKDSDNDGIGDIKGITEKIHHFKESGITAVWLSPIFQSPQVDQGYDISDYYNIEPDYGTIDDLKELIKEAHALDIKVILDFVPNHTSDQHEWFIKSIQSIEPYKDYYIWVNPKIGSNGEKLPPNNWISVFGNSSWTWNDERQQYYFHQFAKAQPDLNYRNPKVIDETVNVMKFWMDHGVDGFRIDAVPHLFEDINLKDEPKSINTTAKENEYGYHDHIYTKDQPETFELIYKWRHFVDNYSQEAGGDPRIIMTECYTTTDKTMLYYGTSNGSQLGAHFSFNFKFITDININSTAKDIENVIETWLNAIPSIYTSNWVLGNHDNHRIATRFGSKSIDGFNMLMAILPGIGVTYNGEEIGQADGEVLYDEGKDPSARDPKIFNLVSRDFERTPYQWDNTVNAGFNTGAKPWLPVSKNYIETNLANEKGNNNSHYKIYQEMMETRQEAALLYGNTTVETIDDDILFVRRCYDDVCIGLMFNIGEEKFQIDISHVIKANNNTILLASLHSDKVKGSTLDMKNVNLEDHEALLIKY